MININFLGRRVTFFSFMIGSLFFVSYLIFRMDVIIGPAYLFVLFATLVNTILLLLVLAQALLDKENRRSYLVTAAIILANIPIAFGYLFLVFDLIMT